MIDSDAIQLEHFLSPGRLPVCTKPNILPAGLLVLFYCIGEASLSAGRPQDCRLQKPRARFSLVRLYRSSRLGSCQQGEY
jgi:hypothetical protein